MGARLLLESVKEPVFNLQAIQHAVDNIGGLLQNRAQAVLADQFMDALHPGITARPLR